MMMRLLPVTVAVGVATLILSTPAIAAPNCEALTGLKLTDTAITEARPNTTGAFTPPGARSRPLDKLPAFCAVKGVLKPTPTSAIQFEVWLPESGWNGKLHVVGNGGLAGTISYPAMAEALRDGFATASTDTGHTAAEPPAWLEDRERVIGYSSRGLHLTTGTATGSGHNSV